MATAVITRAVQLDNTLTCTNGINYDVKI